MIAVHDACSRAPLPTNLNMPRRIKILFVLLSTLLLATCGGGGSASTPVTPVTPVNAAPVANAGLAQSVLTGTLVTLDGSASTDVNNDALTYSWSFNSRPVGSGAALLSPTSIKPTFTADVAGGYVAVLTVNDGKLSSSPATVTVTATVSNVAPVANAGPAQSVSAGTLVTLDGSASSDANNDALTYSWSLSSRPAGSGAALLSPSAVKPTFTADVAGSYVAALTVSDGKLSSGAATVSVTAISLPSLTLNLPARSISGSQLAVVVAAGDPLSEAIASYYQTARGIPAANIIRVTLATGPDTISATDFAALKAELDAKLPGTVQATLLTWTAPSRVVGSCAMSITSALALGFDAKYCASSCASTAASPYFDSESAQPWVDHKLRPSMMLGASTLAAAKTLIDRGVLADASLPTGDGYLMRTSDVNRSVRYADYTALPALWSGNSGLQLSYIDNSAGAASDGISGKSNVLFYFTGLAGVPPGLTSNSFRPGAIADSLTSTGGYLPGGNGQMPITTWLDAGATASYGTVEEPCNYTQKFSKASVLIDQYYRGATLIEAYWKSVQWPGQGLFIGEPLAQPFRDSPGFSVDAGQYLISTRALRANSTYSLQYQTTSSGSWVTLGSFKLTRSQPQSWRVALPTATATQLRWLGPCPTNTAQQCTLSTSP